MKPLKTKVSITLDIDLVDVVKEMAERDDRSFSQYINLILKEWVAAQAHDQAGQGSLSGHRGVRYTKM